MVTVPRYREGMRVLFAGDWHGDEEWADRVIRRAVDDGCETVVQLGDFGFGFFWLGDDPAEPGDWAPRCPFARAVSALATRAGVRVVFVDGNHDNQVLLGRLAE
ncbi:MAG: metallophosphoesterase, partial [Acidimicrobiales bacterium]|nr:metallophosphoesterase [Acidimicrobiales bacterium]